MNFWRKIEQLNKLKKERARIMFNQQLLNRLKSFSWRFGLFLAVAGLGYLSEHVPELGLPEIITILVVYISNETTKFLNHK